MTSSKRKLQITSKSTLQIKAQASGSLSPPKERSQGGNKFKSFSTYFERNIFPQKLIDLYEKSPTHRSAINSKHVFTNGKGFAVVTKDGKPDLKAEKYTEVVNFLNESLFDVYVKCALDYVLTGNYAIEIAINNKTVSVFHKDVSTIRKSKDVSYISNYWTGIRNQNEFNKAIKSGEVTEIDNYVGQTANGNYLLYIHEYSPGRASYGIPDYWSTGGENWIKVENKIPAYNDSRIDNKFMPSGLLTLVGEPPDGKTAEEYIREFVSNFTGVGNNSKLVAQIVSSKDAIPEYEQLNDEPEGIFLTLQDLADRVILRMHRMHPALLLQTPGSLSSANEIQTAYNVFLNTVIKPYQISLLKGFDLVLKLTHPESKLKVVQLSIVDVLSFLDVTQFITKNRVASTSG